MRASSALPSVHYRIPYYVENKRENDRECAGRAEEWAATQDKKTRHLVHTWQDADVLESVDKAPRPLSPHLHACFPRHVSAAPVWNHHLVTVKEGETLESRPRPFRIL